jgi:Holliday junction resolvasome RuvABC endonuclease subunit
LGRCRTAPRIPHEAAAREAVIADVCAALWQSVQGADEKVKAQMRAAIDELLEQAEDEADAKALAASRAERREGVPSTSLDDLKSKLGL